MDAITENNLTDAKVNLIRSIPFIAFLASNTEVRVDNDKATAYATVRGKRNLIGVNEVFFNDVLECRKERAFLLAHELSHIFFEHINRLIDHSYNQSLWNVATDYFINGFLVQSQENLPEEKVTLKMPEMGLYDSRFVDKSADEIYHILLEEDGDGDPEKAAAKHGAGALSDDIENHGSGSGGDSEADGDGSGNGMKPGDYNTSKPRPFDEISRDRPSEEQTIANKQVVAGAISPQIMSEEDIKQMGVGAANLIMRLRELFESRVNWRDELMEFVVSTKADRSSYNRWNRRSGSIVFPVKDGNYLPILFGTDTSGSMSMKEINEALSECFSITEEFDDWFLSVVTCDTAAHLIDTFNSEDGDEFDPMSLDLCGGGGTDMAPILDMMDDMEEDDYPNVVVIVTDGFIPFDALDEKIQEYEVPTILLITSEGEDETTVADGVPSAKVIKLED